MEPVKLLNENKLPSEFWNRAYEMGQLLIGDNIGDMGKYGVTLWEMRMCAADHKCLCHEGSIYFIKEGKEFGEWITTRHILHIIEESGKDTFTIEIFDDGSATDLMYQEVGVKKENIRETVFREADKIRKMFFSI
jgi:hypothetical protein